MRLFRKQTEVVEVFEVSRPNLDDESKWPAWLKRAQDERQVELGTIHAIERHSVVSASVAVVASEGKVLLEWADVIIRHATGEIEVLDVKAFHDTYEQVKEPREVMHRLSTYQKGELLVGELNTLAENIRFLSSRRELSAAITKTQEARMWLQEFLRNNKYN